MLKIIIIMPNADIAELSIKIFEEKNQTIYDGYFYNEEFCAEMMVCSHEELPGLNVVADAIISRGMMAYELRNLYIDIPVVEIPISSMDIMQCIKELGGTAELNDKTGIAAIGSTNMILGIEKMDDIVNVNIKSYIVESYMGIQNAVADAYEEGYRNLMGGMIACNIGKQMGFKVAQIRTSEDSVRHAITEAKRSAYINRLAAQKALRFETILKYASDGIVAVDTKGRVTILNPVAQKILNLEGENYSNTQIETLTSDVKFNKFLSEITLENDRIIKYAQKYLSCNRIPMFLHDEKAGVVITLQDVEKIRDTDHRFRKGIYHKGHIAKYTFYDIIGRSKSIKDMISMAKKYSIVESNILLIGKTGTGKEMIAQGIHNYSKRSSGPFVAVNCAAIPSNLLESELFGYTEGAFTGAGKNGKIGLFEIAHGGTIFLDEISELPFELQGRLLRVIQEKEMMRLGSDTVLTVDVRIISACNKDLADLVWDNQFREDLFYRINTLRIDLPTLAERKEDIPLIVESIMESLKNKTGNKKIVVTDEVLLLLKENDWPGNVRELINCCERMAVLSEDGIIRVEHFHYSMEKRRMVTDFEKLQILLDGNKNKEKEDIVAVLLNCNGKKQEAAKILNMSRSTLWRKIKEYGLQ